MFEYLGPGKGLALQREIEHPEGRKLNQDIDTDRPGMVHESTGGGPSTADRQVDAQRHVAQVFAKTLAEALRSARNDHAFDRLVLVAEPGFLGILRESLDDATGRTVIDTVRKDLAAVRDADIGEHLDGVLTM